MEISAALVKNLREKTGAGMMDCKKALTETAGDFDKAVEWIYTKGVASADKKLGRSTREGCVHSYIHGEGKIGVLLEVNCETDFVARTESFRQFVQGLSLHIAASNPQCLKAEELPVESRSSAEALQTCLMNQFYIKDPEKTVEQVWKEMIAQLGENVSIRRFTRYVLGEGMASE